MRNRLISFKGESVSKMYTYVNVGILYPCNICIQDLTAVTDTCVHDRRLHIRSKFPSREGSSISLVWYCQNV